MLGTTIQLWLKRRRWRRTRWPVLLLVLTLAAASGGLLAQQSRDSAGRRRGARQPLTPAAAARAEAADWVAGQVSRSVLVSCDRAMCSVLRQQGFPAGNLVMMRSAAPNPLGSSVMVVTPALRSELGSLLASYAPVVIAAFGRGSAGIEVRAAAQQLSEGHVDARLIATVGIMTVLHPVHLVSFGDASPGASPGVPLRSVVLYGVTHGVTAGTALLGSLRSLLLAQRPSYRPAAIRIVRLTTGQGAMRIWFAAPGPLGLLNASQPLVKISSP